MRFLSIIYLIVLPILSYGQHFYRVEADFTIKEKINDSLSQLTIGRVYYDQNRESLLYDVSFPSPQIWFLSDSNFYRISDEDSINRQTISPLTVQSSVFHMVLADQLGNFGLSDSLFTKAGTVNQGGMIITTLEPLPKYEPYLGRVLISRKGKLVQGVIIMDPAGEVASKQFYRDYDLSGGLPFPQEIVQFSYQYGKQISVRITTFENIQFNAEDTHQRYHYQLPAQ
ncbi:MAG: hypothetical protein AAGM67_16205 [Bacteroidota bacterium]